MSKRLGQYELGDAIGRGGYATVYRAHHIKLQTEIALKVITPALAADPHTRQRFIQEAQTGVTLQRRVIFDSSKNMINQYPVWSL